MMIFCFSYRGLSLYKFMPAPADHQEFNIDPGTGIWFG
jgi:hypothetical protein